MINYILCFRQCVIILLRLQKVVVTPNYVTTFVIPYFSIISEATLVTAFDQLFFRPISLQYSFLPCFL